MPIEIDPKTGKTIMPKGGKAPVVPSTTISQKSGAKVYFDPNDPTDVRMAANPNPNVDLTVNIPKPTQKFSQKEPISFVSDYKPTISSNQPINFNAMSPEQSRSVLTETYYNQYKDQLGDKYSDAVIQAMATAKVGELYSAQEQLKLLKDASAQQQGLIDQQIKSKELNYQTEEQKRKAERDQALRDFERELALKYDPQKERAAEQSANTTAATERLLGATGRLTTRPGSNELVDIEERLTSTLSAIDAAKNMEYKLYKAQLEGRDETYLASLANQLSALQDRAAQAKADTLQNLLIAEQTALEAGNKAQQQFVQDMLSTIVEDEISIDLEASKQQGFVVDINGQPMFDGSGKLIELPEDQQNFTNGASFIANGRQYLTVLDTATGDLKLIDGGAAPVKSSGGGGGGRSGGTSGNAGLDRVFTEIIAASTNDDGQLNNDALFEYAADLSTRSDLSPLEWTQQILDYGYNTGIFSEEVADAAAPKKGFIRRLV